MVPLQDDHGALGLSLGQPRFLAASALVLVFTAATGIVGLAQLRSTARAYDSLVEREAGLTKDLLEMQLAVNEEAVGVRNFVLSGGDKSSLARYTRGVEAFGRELGQAQTKLDDAEDFARIEDIRRRHEGLIPIYRREIALTRRGRPGLAAELGRTRAQRERDGLTRTLNALVSSEADELYSGRARVSSLQRTSEMAILALLLFALLAAAVLATMAARAVRRRAGAEADAERARGIAAEEGAIARIATAVARETEPTAVLQAAAREAATLLEAAAAAIVRFEPGGREATVVGSAGGADADAGRRLRLDASDVLGSCAVAGAPSAHDGTGSDISAPGSAGPRGELAVVIRVGGDPWGAIWVAARPGAELGLEAADRLERFADLASASITSADARAHLAQLALEDSLTGLANHRHFHERLNAETARAQRHERPLSVVLFDLDHFKDVNELHGHHVGDAVLRETAERLAACARSGELVARIGGEQFGWILPEAGGLDAYQAAERARRLLRATPMAAGGIRVTASAGVCDLEHATTAGELLRFADGALFWAKAHGRDMTFRYSPDVVTELSAAEQLEHLRRTRTIVGIRALARAVDVKDKSTARHSERVAEIATSIARVLGWDGDLLDDLHEAALVHDVGKIGVPDAILLKSSRLDPAEYQEIKRHPSLSAEIVDDVLSDEQVAWVRGHHERFDGRGYPDGLAGATIPLGARILAVADAWDVITSERPYSAARDPQEALGEMREQSGRQFCPDVVDALEHMLDERRASRPAAEADA